MGRCRKVPWETSGGAPMPRKVLSQEEAVTMLTLKEKGMSSKAIANLLGVTKGAVRYRLRRAENG